NKRGLEERQSYFAGWAVRGQEGRKALLHLVDEDTLAYAAVMEAFRLPKTTDEEKKIRQTAIEAGTLRATESPLNTMRVAAMQFELLEPMFREGNQCSISDAG